jgi:uncharacterized protein involved in exopolysaccharide biosynthesis
MAAADAARRSELQREVKAAEENFLLYRKKYADAREAETLDQKRVLNVALVEEARPPARIEKRQLWFYLALGLLLATVGGAAAGFTVEILDHSVHTPRELEHCSSLAVLACVPESRQV